MVRIKYLPCIFKVEIILGIFTPWKVKQSLNIVDLNRVFGGGRIETTQFIKLFVKYLFNFFGFSLFLILLNFFFTGISTKLILNSLHLLVKKEFPLLLIEIYFDFRLQFVFKLQNLNFLYQEFKQHESPVAYTVNFQKFLLILNFDVGV